MMNPLTIEVEVRDCTDQQLLRLQSDPVDISLINSLRENLEEQAGGLLCMAHYQLPDFRAEFARGRWIVRITSCCKLHMVSIEQRLQEIYEK